MRFDEKDLDDIVVEGGSQGEYVPNKKQMIQTFL